MSATAIQTSPAQLSVIGRYTVSEEARVLVGRRIEGKVFVYDYPRDGQGRRYFVESGFESKAELAVLLADYRREAKRLGTCPMSHDAVVGEQHRQLRLRLESRLDEVATTLAVARVVVDEDLALDTSTDQDARLLGDGVATDHTELCGTGLDCRGAHRAPPWLVGGSREPSGSG